MDTIHWGKPFLNKIKLLYRIFLVFISLLCLFISLLIYVHYLHEKSVKNRFESRLVADELRQSSDDLTRMARCYVVTADGRFEKMPSSLLIQI